MFDVVREADFPEYLKDKLSNWGRWVSSVGKVGRAGGLEGLFRSNRCPDCYEMAGPCDACKVQANSGFAIDVADAELMESAWVAMGVGRVEKLLLREYFVHRRSPRAIVNKTGIRRDEFWYLLLRGGKEVEQHARIISCRSRDAVPSLRRQVTDLPGWQVQRVA